MNESLSKTRFPLYSPSPVRLQDKRLPPVNVLDNTGIRLLRFPVRVEPVLAVAQVLEAFVATRLAKGSGLLPPYSKWRRWYPKPGMSIGTH